MKEQQQIRDAPARDIEDAFPSPHQAERTTDSPLIRVMALHALAYCERLFYLEEVEEIRLADANVYAGRRVHTEIENKHLAPELATMEVCSETLGIRGKLDWFKREDGRLFVYEYKKGRSQKGKEPWPSDRLQAIAYALLLAENSGQDVAEARIRYLADNKLIHIPITEDVESEVRQAVARAHELRALKQRPPVDAPERMCRTCSLAPVCLPEEERFARKEKEKITRLFPPDEDRRVVHLVEPGSRISRDGEQFAVSMPDKDVKRLPGHGVSSLVLHGNVQITTQCLQFCAANGVGVHWLSGGGRYIAGLSAGPGGVQRRIRQYEALTNASLRACLAGKLCKGKVENQMRYLMRISRKQERPAQMEEGLSSIRSSLREIGRINAELENGDVAADTAQQMVGTLRGLEGAAASRYFRLLPLVMGLKQGDLLHFSRRSRRPPRDPFNSLLSFGYALLYKECMSALLAVGLEPALGFMHTPRSSAHPLVLDLMDLFRVMLWDVPLVGAVGRKQWKESDFKRTQAMVWLNEDGRRKAISLFESRKREKWKHPVLQYSLSYARTVELEARLLEKEWAGEPGLFARLRLR